MNNYLITSQLIVALSVAYIWIFRYEVIVKEFKQFGINDLTRAFVGAAKIALATLLIAGIWYPALVAIPAILMGFFMLSAQYFHFKAKNPLAKRLPSLFFLILCVYIALTSLQIF